MLVRLGAFFLFMYGAFIPFAWGGRLLTKLGGRVGAQTLSTTVTTLTDRPSEAGNARSRPWEVSPAYV